MLLTHDGEVERILDWAAGKVMSSYVVEATVRYESELKEVYSGVKK